MSGTYTQRKQVFKAKKPYDAKLAGHKRQRKDDDDLSDLHLEINDEEANLPDGTETAYSDPGFK